MDEINDPNVQYNFGGNETMRRSMVFCVLFLPWCYDGAVMYVLSSFSRSEHSSLPVRDSRAVHVQASRVTGPASSEQTRLSNAARTPILLRRDDLPPLLLFAA